MTRPVFYFEDTAHPLSSFLAGHDLELGGPEGRHAATVRRIGQGERLDLVDGKGTRALCEVRAVTPSGLSLRIDTICVEPEPSPRIILVQALAKGGRDEQAIEVCTEIGVDACIPWQSQRAIVRWTGPKADKGKKKWESVVRSAAKQSRRSRIPRVNEVCDTSTLSVFLTRELAGGAKAFLCHEEAREPLTSILNAGSSELTDASALFILVGPEGGVSPEETRLLTQAGASLVGLGSAVLRSSTAGAVCATLLAAHLGRI